MNSCTILAGKSPQQRSLGDGGFNNIRSYFKQQREMKISIGLAGSRLKPYSGFFFYKTVINFRSLQYKKFLEYLNKDEDIVPVVTQFQNDDGHVCFKTGGFWAIRRTRLSSPKFPVLVTNYTNAPMNIVEKYESISFAY